MSNSFKINKDTSVIIKASSVVGMQAVNVVILQKNQISGDHVIFLGPNDISQLIKILVPDVDPRSLS